MTVTKIHQVTHMIGMEKVSFKDSPSKFNQSEDPSLAKSIADSKNITGQQDLTSKSASLKSDVSGTHLPTQNSDKQNEDFSSSYRVYDTANIFFDKSTNHGTNTVSEHDLNVNSAGDEDRQVANKISNAANSTKDAEKILEREHAGSYYQGNRSSASKQTERPLGKSSSDKNEKLTDIKPKGEKLSSAVSSKTQSTSNQNQATVNPSDVPSTHKQEKTYAEGGQTNDQLTDHLRTSDNQSDDPRSQTTENPPIHSVEYDREVVVSDVNVTVPLQSSLENQNQKQSLDKEEELMRENSSSQGDVITKTLTKDESVMAEEVVKVDTERNGNIPQKTAAPDLDGARSSLALSPTKSDTKDEEQQNNNPNISPCQSVSTSVNLTENGSIAAGRHKQQTLKNMAEGFRKVLEKFDVLHQDKIKREELINELTQHVSEQLEKPIEMETLDRDMEGNSRSWRNDKGSSKKNTERASQRNEGSNTQKGNSRPLQHQQFQDIVNIPFPKFMHISMHEKWSIKKFAEQYKVTVEEKSHGFQLKGEEDDLKIVGDELRKRVDEIETKQLITSEVEVLAADDFSALKSLSQGEKCYITHSPTWITGAVEISVLCCEAKEIDKSTLAYPVDTVAEDEWNGDANEESNFLTFKMPQESENKYIHAYEDSLKLLFKKANGKDISSLSFPIEAFKNYPKLKYKVLVKGITVALKDFQGEMNGMPHLRNVILCSDETDPCEELKRILTDASPKYVNSQPIKISTVVGKISEQKVDVLVNTISSDLNLQHGAVAKSIYNAAGDDIQRELSKVHGNQIKHGQVAVTKGFKLQCKHVFHGALLGWDKEKGESKKVLQTFVQSCLHHMDFHGYKTIAFPVLGAGLLKIPVQVVAPVMRKTIEDHRKLHPETKITEVKIVCLEDLEKEFREALKLEEPGPHFEMCVENTTTHLTVGSVDPPLIDAYDAIVVLWTKDNLFKAPAQHSKIQGKDWSTRRRKNVQEKGFEVTKRDYGKMTINFFVKDENNLKEIVLALKRAIDEGCSRVCIELRSSDPLAKDCKKFALSVLNAVKKLQKSRLEEVRLNFDQKSLMTSACHALQGPAAVVTKSQNVSLEITGKKSDVAAVRKRLQDFLTVENKQTQVDVAEPPPQAIQRDLPQIVSESKGAKPKTSEQSKKEEGTKRDKLVRTKEEECCVILSFKTSPTESLPQQTDAGIKAKLTSDFQNRKEDLLIVYPFNSPQKALIKCKSADDACSLLRTFKLEAYELKEFEAQALNDLEAKLTQPVIDLIQQCGLSCDEIEANCGAVLDKQQWVLTGNLLEIQAAHSYLKTRLQAERRKDSTSEVSRKTENSQTSGAAAMQKKYLCLSNETIKIMKHFFKDLPFDKVSQKSVSANEVSISGNQINISEFENAQESIQNLAKAELNNVCQTEFHTLEREITTHDDFMLQFMKKDKKVIVLGKNQEQVHAVKDQMVTVLQRQKPQSPGPSMSKGSKNKNFPEGHVACFPIDELSYDVFRSMHWKDKSYEGKLELIKDENRQLQMQVLLEKVDDFRNAIRNIESMSKSYVDVDLAVNDPQYMQQQCPLALILISLLYADKIIVIAKSSQVLSATADVLMKILRSQCVTVFSEPVIKHFCKSANQNIISVSSQGTHNTIVTGPKGIMNKIKEEMKALEGMTETYIDLKDVWNDTVVNYLYDKGRSQDNLYVHVDSMQRRVHVCGTERDISDIRGFIKGNEWHLVPRSSKHQIKKLNITISEGDFQSVHSEGIINPMDAMKVESDILVYAGEEVKRKVLHFANAMKDLTIPTDAGSLKQHGAEVIFHVFVPRWLGSKVDTVAFKGELFEILKMCFSEAKKRKISSLVIPSFGKVDTHAPDIVCATTYAECVKEFSRADTGTLKDIHFVDSTGEMFDLMNAAFQQSLPWIFRKPDGECQYHLSHQMVVKVTDGDILDVKADALVVREDPEFKSTSYPAKVFTAGKRFPENYSKKIKKLKGKYMNLRQGDIHHLDMKIGGSKIFLAIMPDQFKHYIDYNDYKSCMKNVLQKLCDTGIKTVALPFFGGGGRDKKKCAELLVGELLDFSKSMKQRPIVVHIQDKVENLQLIHDEFQSCFHKDKALGNVWERNAEVLVLPPS